MRTAGISFIALAVLQFRPDPHLRRGRASSRPSSRSSRVLMLVPLLGILLIRNEKRLRRQGARRRLRRERAPPLLRLDRRAHGEPARPLQPDQPRRRRRARLHLRHARAALPARRPGARQASRRSPRASRLDAKLTGANPIDVLIEFPKGAVALRARDARTHRRRACRSSRSRRASATSGRWRRCGAGCAEKAGISRRRHAQAICRHAARAPDPPLHLGEAGRGRRLGPHPGHRREPASAR